MGRPDLDAWEKRFSSDRYAFGTEPNAYHQRSAHLIPAGARVLVVADSEGATAYGWPQTATPCTPTKPPLRDRQVGAPRGRARRAGSRIGA